MQIPSTERIDETTRRNVNARQRQKEYTKERDTTTAETKDRENGRKNVEERQWSPQTVRID